MITNFTMLGFLGLGGQEIIIILIIILVLFGGTKIPQLMRGLGRGMNEFKKAKAGLYDDEEDLKTEKSKETEPKANK